jgi:hypothetical protein
MYTIFSLYYFYNIMKITIISSLYNCNQYIDNYIESIINLNDFINHKLIIWNVIDSNSQETNDKINNLCKNKNNITLLNKTKEEDTGLYNSWNVMLELVDTELVCNFNADDKLHPNFIVDYLNEFKNDNNLNLLCSPLYISKDINDTFNSDLPLMYDKKKIFFDNDDNLEDNTESNSMNYEYKFNLLKKCLEHKCKTKTTWAKFNNISIFDFFRIDGNNFIDLNNYNLFTFCGCAPVWKIELFKKYGGFNENEYGIAGDLELWLRYFQKEGNFKILNKSYIIYYANPNSYGHSQENELCKRKIIKKYHPIFKLFDNKIDVIVPYRDREIELKLFIETFKKSHDIYFDYKIIICEQTSNIPFSRSKIFNYGIEYSNKKKLLLTDVDLLYNKINLGIISNDNKIYGMINNKLSIGGGAIVINIDTIKKINGYSYHYNGWGSEDMDFTYRLYFNNIKINTDYMIDRTINNNEYIKELKLHEEEASESYIKKQKEYSQSNNTILIQQIINYNLFFYYENKQKFISKENKIFYNEKLFFEGNFNDNILEYGELYDLISYKNISDFVKVDNVIIYKGAFEGGLPYGYGTGYNLWGNPCFKGLMLNGYLFKRINNWEFLKLEVTNKMNLTLSSLNEYTQLNILNENDFKIYKNYVYQGLNKISNNYEIKNIEKTIQILKINLNNNEKFCSLHVSKKMNSGYEFIKDNYELCSLKSLDSDFKIELKEIGLNKIYYFNQNWQYPVITEKSIFDLYFNHDTLPYDYFAFPWATLLDQINSKRETNLLNFILNYKIDSVKCFTVCQSIAFRRFLPLFKKIGITHIFASHCSYNDYILEDKYGIKIYPFPLFPVNYNEMGKENTKKYLFSFCGSYDKNCYLNDIRKRLDIYKNKDDCYIKIKDKWHFHDIVYEKQINNNDNINLDNMKSNELDYSELLLNSTFSLCPSGTGPNSIRFWESLSFGSIPVLLSNEHKLPEYLNWDDFCIIYDDRDINNLYDYLKLIPLEKIEMMQFKCKQVFKNYFSKTNIHKTIEIESKNLQNINIKTINSLNDIIKKYNIKQLNVSEGIDPDTKDKIKKYNLQKITNKNDPALFLGLYRLEDIKLVCEHKGIKIIYWHNNDCNINYEIRKQVVLKINNLSDVHHICSYDKVAEYLDSLSIECTKI